MLNLKPIDGITVVLPKSKAEIGSPKYLILLGLLFVKLAETVGLPNVLGEKNPNRIRYFGDPISALDFGSTTVMPSMGFRWKNSAHSYKDLFINDAVPLHDVEKNPLTVSPDDSKAEVISY